MDWLVRLFAGMTATFAVVGFWGVNEPTPTVPTPTPFTTLITLPIASQTPSTTTIPQPPADALCPQWWALAREAGWTEDLLPTLDYAMWKESRCDPTQHNTTLNRDGSADVGLTQINDRSWCLPTRWYPGGYLQTIGVLPTVGCEQLFDPYLNLLSAKAIYDYAQQSNGNGWHPWKL
jgi:hypothetical protein